MALMGTKGILLRCQTAKRTLARDDIAEKASDVIIANAREIDRKREMIAEKNNDIR
jgi:hypothetical protein